MGKSEKEGTVVGAAALLGLLFIAVFSSTSLTKESITGAVSGESYVYEMCLKKYGRDLYGKYDWEKIEYCREQVQYSEKKGGDNKGTPRLYLSSDRSAYQNEEE